MNTLIAVAGKTGTTMRCAALLSVQLGGAQIINLELKTPDPADYDLIIVGSAVRMGQLHRKVRDFLARYEQALLAKPFACFVCCGFGEQAQEYLKTGFGPALLAHACAAGSFGGEMRTEELTGMDKFLVGMVAKSLKEQNKPLPTVDMQAIARFAETLKAGCDSGVDA